MRKKYGIKTIKKIETKEVGGVYYATQNAITLISLIITIIILIILAGVTISSIIGNEGLFGTAQTAAEKTAVAELKEKADIAYTTLKAENYEKEIQLVQVIEKLQAQGYAIVTTSNGGVSKIIGITVNPESVIMGLGETKNVEVTVHQEETEGTRYYANIYNAYYEVTLEKGEIKIRKKAQKFRKSRSTENIK